MKNKKILITIVFSVVCAAIILTVIIIGYRNKKSSSEVSRDFPAVSSFNTLEEAVEYAGFSMKCPDRLNGVIATNYSASQDTVVVTYGRAGYISKTLLTDPEGREKVKPSGKDLSEHEIDGMTVYYVGDENTVLKAGWIDNGYEYVIFHTSGTVSASVMTDEVLATR